MHYFACRSPLLLELVSRGKNGGEGFTINFVLVRDAEPSGLRRCADARRCFWNWLLMRGGFPRMKTKKP